MSDTVENTIDDSTIEDSAIAPTVDDTTDDAALATPRPVPWLRSRSTCSDPSTLSTGPSTAGE